MYDKMYQVTASQHGTVTHPNYILIKICTFNLTKNKHVFEAMTGVNIER